MFGYRKERLASIVATLVVAGSLALLAGCAGMDRSPLAPVQKADVSTTVSPAAPHAVSSQGAFSLSFSPTPRPRATKPTGNNAVADIFSPENGGYLSLSFPNASDSTGVVKQATFQVVPGAMDTTVQITMDVYNGTTLDDVNVVFSPSGLAFNPPAVLTMTFVGSIDANLDTVTVYHLHEGVVTEIQGQIIHGNGEWSLVVEVPGFSSYSLGGDDGIPAPEVPGPNGP